MYDPEKVLRMEQVTERLGHLLCETFVILGEQGFPMPRQLVNGSMERLNELYRLYVETDDEKELAVIREEAKSLINSIRSFATAVRQKFGDNHVRPGKDI